VDRPEIVTKAELESPSAEQTEGMQRGEAFAHDGVWAGHATFPGGASTGWHHHGDYATYAYVTDGSMTLEFGADRRASGRPALPCGQDTVSDHPPPG
jgi:uncharacterized RmlC-like cupin family protein